MKTRLQFLCFFMLLSFTVSAATEKIIIDQINGNTNYPRPSGFSDVTYPATNGNWNANDFTKKIPVLAGSNYSLIVIGDWLDVWDRLEITKIDGKTAEPAVTCNAIVKSKVNGKGQTAIRVNVGALPAGAEFMIRFRYTVESNLLDKMPGENISFKVVLRGNITNVAIQPDPILEQGKRYLRPKVDYTLNFSLTGLPGAGASGAAGGGVTFIGKAEITRASGGSAMTEFRFQRKSSTDPSFIVSASSGSFSMKVKSTSNLSRVTNACNLLDEKNLLFALVAGDVDPAFKTMEKCYHVAATVGTLNNTLPNSNLTDIVPGVDLPDLEVPNANAIQKGLTYSFSNVTVTDASGKVYKALKVDNNNPNDLGQLIGSGALNNLGGSSAGSNVTKSLGTDPQLGAMFLSEILLGQYVIPVKNSGPKETKPAFRNRYKSNMTAANPVKLPERDALTQRTVFPATTTVEEEIPFIAPGNQNNSLVNKQSIQVFTFQNRPGLFYCDNNWPLESNLEVSLDFTKTNDEVFEDNNTKEYK